MIRRDYILRMIEEFVRALARINSLKRGQRWTEAGEAIDEEFRRLMGLGPQAVSRLSETELLALLVQAEPTPAVREKALLLTTLLKQAGDVAAAQGRAEESQACYLKALRLLLDVLGRGEVFECPEFAPKVEMLGAAIGEALPMRTRALLMEHYERAGEFAKAEDELFRLIDGEPENAGLVEFGIAFYQRLLARSDEALAAGHLPRSEVQQALTELGNRRAQQGGTEKETSRREDGG